MEILSRRWWVTAAASLAVAASAALATTAFAGSTAAPAKAGHRHITHIAEVLAMSRGENNHERHDV
jgi:hypothetical protein